MGWFILVAIIVIVVIIIVKRGKSTTDFYRSYNSTKRKFAPKCSYGGLVACCGNFDRVEHFSCDGVDCSQCPNFFPLDAICKNYSPSNCDNEPYLSCRHCPGFERE